MKLNVWAFGLTCALLWGVGLFAITWWVIAFAEADKVYTTVLSRVYLGYAVTPVGSVIGLAWAFADGLIGGAIFAWLYNLLSGRICVKSAVA
ncbi:MAG: bacteriophage holin [Planctomycetota bacterium]|jgi:hypothetical protein